MYNRRKYTMDEPKPIGKWDVILASVAVIYFTGHVIASMWGA